MSTLLVESEVNLAGQTDQNNLESVIIVPEGVNVFSTKKPPEIGEYPLAPRRRGTHGWVHLKGGPVMCTWRHGVWNLYAPIKRSEFDLSAVYEPKSYTPAHRWDDWGDESGCSVRGYRLLRGS